MNFSARHEKGNLNIAIREAIELWLQKGEKKK